MSLTKMVRWPYTGSYLELNDENDPPLLEVVQLMVEAFP